MKRLLLCHPDPEVQRAVERTLIPIGVTMDVASDVDDVLLRVGLDDPLVVVVDRVLAGPRMNEVIDTLRERRSSKPIVIVTSTDDADLDPNVVSLIVPSDYDAPMLVGVILACATDTGAPVSMPAAMHTILPC